MGWLDAACSCPAEAWTAADAPLLLQRTQAEPQRFRGSKAAKSDIRKQGKQASRRAVIGLGRTPLEVRALVLRRLSSLLLLRPSLRRRAHPSERIPQVPAAPAFLEALGGMYQLVRRPEPEHVEQPDAASSAVPPDDESPSVVAVVATIAAPARESSSAPPARAAGSEEEERAPTRVERDVAAPIEVSTTKGGTTITPLRDDKLPPGWLGFQHVSSGGHAYKRYKGPNGERAQSTKEAWRKATGSEPPGGGFAGHRGLQVLQQAGATASSDGMAPPPTPQQRPPQIQAPPLSGPSPTQMSGPSPTTLSLATGLMGLGAISSNPADQPLASPADPSEAALLVAAANAAHAEQPEGCSGGSGGNARRGVTSQFMSMEDFQSQQGGAQEAASEYSDPGQGPRTFFCPNGCGFSTAKVKGLGGHQKGCRLRFTAAAAAGREAAAAAQAAGLRGIAVAEAAERAVRAVQAGQAGGVVNLLEAAGGVDYSAAPDYGPAPEEEEDEPMEDVAAVADAAAADASAAAADAVPAGDTAAPSATAPPPAQAVSSSDSYCLGSFAIGAGVDEGGQSGPDASGAPNGTYTSPSLRPESSTFPVTPSALPELALLPEPATPSESTPQPAITVVCNPEEVDLHLGHGAAQQGWRIEGSSAAACEGAQIEWRYIFTPNGETFTSAAEAAAVAAAFAATGATALIPPPVPQPARLAPQAGPPRYANSDAASPSRPSGPAAEFGPGTFAVEKILGERQRRGKVEYLISWLGFDSSHDSWEPQENVLDPHLLASWRQRQPPGSEPPGQPETQPQGSASLHSPRAEAVPLAAAAEAPAITPTLEPNGEGGENRGPLPAPRRGRDEVCRSAARTPGQQITAQ